MKKPYIIAEIGVNYYDIAVKEGISNIEAAKKMIYEAKNAGASAAKFQSYKAEKIASKNSPSYWDTSKEPTTNQYDLFKKFDNFGEKEYVELARYCDTIGIDFMSTPFDLEAVEYLDPLVKIHKISSSDITNFQLLTKVARTQKKIILSTGSSNLKEIKEAIEIIEGEGNFDIVLLHCVLNYPTDNKNANLSRITSLQNNFPQYGIGYSDHTLPDNNMTVLTTSYLLGANYIEKHFTLDKTLPGNDHYHSMDIYDLRLFNSNVSQQQYILGDGEIDPKDNEYSSRKNARRSVVTKRFIPKGTILTEGDLTCKRPASGIPANKFYDLIGKKSLEDIEEDTILKNKMFK